MLSYAGHLSGKTMLMDAYTIKAAMEGKSTWVICPKGAAMEIKARLEERARKVGVGIQVIPKPGNFVGDCNLLVLRHNWRDQP